MAEYRFLQTRDGITRFAKATVFSTECQTWGVTLVEETSTFHRKAVYDGVYLAIAEQSQRNGTRYAVVVTSIVETAADTSPDAVECAVAIATWMSFGREARDLSVRFEQGRWNVLFNRAKSHGADSR